MQSSFEDLCIICLKPKQNNKFSPLYHHQDENTLTEIGNLYQDVVQISILVTNENEIKTPKFICSQCEKQIRLFHRFKKKAIDSYHSILKTIYKTTNEMQLLNTIENFIQIEEITIIDAKTEKETEKFQIKYLNNDYLDDENGDGANDDNDNFILGEENDLNCSSTNTNYPVFIEQNLNGTIETTSTSITSHRNSEDQGQTQVERELEDNNPYYCQCCRKNYQNHYAYELHRYNVHSTHAVTCQICFRIFNNENDFNLHIQKEHLNLSSHKCKICNTGFTGKNDLMKHMKTMHGNSDNTCKICGKTFSKILSLKAHMETHSDNRPFSCETCGKTFRSSSHCNYHKYSHMDKQFQCKICEQWYSTPRTLKDHMKFVHHGVKPHVCDICNKSFQRKSKMILHREGHFK